MDWRIILKETNLLRSETLCSTTGWLYLFIGSMGIAAWCWNSPFQNMNLIMEGVKCYTSHIVYQPLFAYIILLAYVLCFCLWNVRNLASVSHRRHRRGLKMNGNTVLSCFSFVKGSLKDKKHKENLYTQQGFTWLHHIDALLLYLK